MLDPRQRPYPAAEERVGAGAALPIMAEDSTRAPWVDEETPRRLVRQGGQRLLRTVTRSYVEHWERRIGELEQAIANERGEEVRRIAHGMRSSSDLVGLCGLGRLFGALEAEAGVRAGAQAAALIRGELDAAFEKVRPWIEMHAGR